MEWEKSQKMAAEQTNIAEAVVQAAAEAARVAVQAIPVDMDTTGHEGTQNMGPR